MKITSIDALQLPSGNKGATTRGAWSPVLVRVNTDEGICGWGEAGLAYGKGWRAGRGMIQDFAEQIIGMNPMNTEEVWETIFRKTFWGMGGGTVVSAAMSAIDIALLDIKGKHWVFPSISFWEVRPMITCVHMPARCSLTGVLISPSRNWWNLRSMRT